MNQTQSEVGKGDLLSYIDEIAFSLSATFVRKTLDLLLHKTNFLSAGASV